MVPAAPAITELMLHQKNATEESIYDRCYRIRNLKTQVLKHFDSMHALFS